MRTFGALRPWRSPYPCLPGPRCFLFLPQQRGPYPAYLGGTLPAARTSVARSLPLPTWVTPISYGPVRSTSSDSGRSGALLRICNPFRSLLRRVSSFFARGSTRCGTGGDQQRPARLCPRAQLRGVDAIAYLPAGPAEELQVGRFRQDRQPGLASVSAP